MEHERLSGTLREWNDSRGFGFIQPESGNRKIFLHISDLRRAIRRPQVGDSVSYVLSTQTEGKPRAIQAFLVGVPTGERYEATKPASRSSSGLGFLLGAGALVLLFGSPLKSLLTKPTLVSKTSQSATMSTTTLDDDTPQSDSFAPPGYTIKGNISVGTGRRLYHTPGCEDYDETVIDLNRGERWFRTPSEAKASGWSDAHSPH